MRKFKFRVYIPEHQKFTYFELNTFDYSDRYLDQAEYPVQQFTGLFDKDNQEIYEGDIVLDTYYGSLRTAKITYQLGSFWLDSNHLHEDLERELYDTDFEKHIKVIGNIFESPEQLYLNK